MRCAAVRASGDGEHVHHGPVACVAQEEVASDLGHIGRVLPTRVNDVYQREFDRNGYDDTNGRLVCVGIAIVFVCLAHSLAYYYE